MRSLQLMPPGIRLFSSFSRTSPTSPTVILGSTLQTPSRMRRRTTALPRLEESAFLRRVTIHPHRPHRFLLQLRPVQHPFLRYRLVRRVLVLLQVAPRVGVVRLVVTATHVVALRVVYLRGAGQRHVVDVAR